ncbi:carboxypeptidase-like regulatory domain-containing protein [Fabibacter sp. E12]|nr:carboxypeptidase-like regulatory domain-containing protein [Roseivirga sp. E12]
MHLLFTLVLFVSIQSSGLTQTTIKGQVVDSETNEGIPYAHVLFLKGSVGTATNLEGFFQLTLNNANSLDSIVIRSIGYSPKKLRIDNSLNKQTFKLIPDFLALDEVEVVGEKGRFDIRKFMLDVVEKYNQQRNQKSHIAKAHYKEYALFNGKHIMYFQSLGYSIMTELAEDFSPIGNYRFFYENTRAHIENPKWAAYDANLNDEYNRGNVRPSGWSILNLFRRIEVWGLLSEEFVTKYKFKFENEFIKNSKLIYQVSYKWKGDRGLIDIDANSLAVISIAAETNNYFSNAFSKQLKASAKIDFSYYDNTPYLSLANIKYQHKGLSHHLELQIMSQKFNDFEMSADELKSLSQFESNPLIQYKPAEFEFLDFIRKGPTEQVAIDLAGSGKRLEDYFVAYSGKWLGYEFRKTRTIPSNTILEKLSSLKKNF